MSSGNMFHILLRDPFALAVFLLISLVPTAFLGWGLWLDYQIASEGVVGEARVTACRISHGGRNSSDKYIVDYSFSPPGKYEKYNPSWIHRALQLSVPKETFDLARKTKRLAVLYVPDKPYLNRPRKCGATSMIVFLFVICLGLNGLLLVGVFTAQHFRDEARRMRDSQAALAEGRHYWEEPQG